jgi:UDP-glucose 4-epimerase
MDPQSDRQVILVTGGAGFIGSHLVDRLVSRGYKTVILDNLSSGTLNNLGSHLKNGNAKLMKGDVRNMNDVRKALTSVDLVFHLAAIVSVPYSVQNPEITHEVNAGGTRNLLEASAKSNVKCFVYVSSSAVYGEPQYLPVDEDHPTNPMSPYAETKIRGEDYCREYQEKYGLRTVTLRFFNVYGQRQDDSGNSGVITRFIKNLRENKPPIIYGDGEQTRDFIHVSDSVQALLLSMNNPVAFGQTFNIGSGERVKIRQLCELVMGKLGAEIKPVYEEPRSGEIKNSYANIAKAERILGFKPKISLEKGLEDLARRWKC